MEAVAADPVTAHATAREAVAPAPPIDEGVDIGTRPADPSSDLLDTTVDVAHRAVDQTGAIAQDPIGFGEQLGDAVVEGSESFVHSTAEHLRTGVTDWAERAAEDAGVDLPDRLGAEDLLATGGQVAGRTAEQLGDRYEEGATELGQVGDQALGLVQDGVDWTAQQGEQVLETAQQGVDWTAERTAQLGDEALGATEEGAAWTMDHVSAVRTTTFGAVEGGVDWATDTAGDAAEAGSDLVEDAVDAVGELADDAAEAYEEAADAAQETMHDVHDTAMGIIDNLF